MKESIPLIDIDKVFKSKNPTLYRILPGFIFRYIKRIIHQDFMNDFKEIAESIFFCDINTQNIFPLKLLK